MRCPSCNGTGRNRVVDSRESREGRAVRRRRECADCETRFTTYEYVAERTPQVSKRSGSAEDFSRDKLIKGMRAACAKRPVSPVQLESIADAVEDRVSGTMGNEISSGEIGELVMDRLRALDHVADVRFASVYRNFQDAEEFERIAEEMIRVRRREAMTRNQSELTLTPLGSVDPSPDEG